MVYISLLASAVKESMAEIIREGQFVVRLDSKVVVIRSQKGLIFCGWNIRSSFKREKEKESRIRTVRSHLEDLRGKGWELQ